MVRFLRHLTGKSQQYNCLSTLLSSAILIPQLIITLQQGDSAVRFQVTYKQKIIFILCSFFPNKRVVSLLKIEMIDFFQSPWLKKTGKDSQVFAESMPQELERQVEGRGAGLARRIDSFGKIRAVCQPCRELTVETELGCYWSARCKNDGQQWQTETGDAPKGHNKKFTMRVIKQWKRFNGKVMGSAKLDTVMNSALALLWGQCWTRGSIRSSQPEWIHDSMSTRTIGKI